VPIAEAPCGSGANAAAADDADGDRYPSPSPAAELFGSNLPPLCFGGATFSRHHRVRVAWNLGLADRQAVLQWDAGRFSRQIPSPLWISERPKAVYCVLRLPPPGQPAVYRCYETYRALTHPGGVWRRSISRGLLTEAEARVYLQAVALESPLEWI
jgi:hypothetical protein